MMFCDLAINSIPIWYGVPCMQMVGLKSKIYLAFSGQLVFIDSKGNSDPTYTGLADRFALIYIDTDENMVQVPLQAIPAQTIDVVLGNQNCSLAFYEKDVTLDFPTTIPYFSVVVPEEGFVLHTGGSRFTSGTMKYDPTNVIAWSFTAPDGSSDGTIDTTSGINPDGTWSLDGGPAGGWVVYGEMIWTFTGTNSSGFSKTIIRHGTVEA